MTDAFRQLPDLAVRPLGGAVLWTNDQSFAESENLIVAAPAEFRPHTFGHRGQMYDGWETRRRRSPDAQLEDGPDEVIVRLGVPGEIAGVIVDTAWFVGNFPPQIAVLGAELPGYPSVDDVRKADWTTIVERAAARGDAENSYVVRDSARYTHVKLQIFPDGGVARLRVHGYARPDPALLAGAPFDLAAIENGGRISGCSNMFYSSPNNLLMPGNASSMGDGWETSRRRGPGNDWVQVSLAGRGVISQAEIDTTWFIGNAPGAVTVSGRDGSGPWRELLGRTVVQPDTRHRFPLEVSDPVTEVRVDAFPDGGFSRLRLWGSLAP